MDYIAVLDYEHLDNGVFLATFARSLAQKKRRGIIIHGDSEYTDRIIQTGMMREDARVRAIKELNHRLVALFADEGVSTIALNGFQKNLITFNKSDLILDKSQLLNLPSHPTLLISNLVRKPDSDQLVAAPLPQLADTLSSAFDIEKIILFSTDDSADIIKKDLPDSLCPKETENGFLEQHVPPSFHSYGDTIHLRTATTF
jgi:hypothetical protein